MNFELKLLDFDFNSDKICFMKEELQQYLSKVEGYLKDISPLERANIVLEVSNQVEAQIASYPDKSIHQVLEAIGTPSSLANHYRLSKGLKTFKENKPFSFLKFCLYIIAFMSISFFVVGAIVVWKFTPVFEVDEKNNRVTVLGGLVDINGRSGRVKIMDHYQYVDNTYTNSFEGSIDILDNEFDEVVINFSSGIMNLSFTNTNKLSWVCKLESAPKENFINKSMQIIELDFEDLEGVSCDLTIPSTLKSTLDAKDGRVIVTEPLTDVYVELENGQILFKPNPEINYKYEVDAQKGTVMGNFESSTKDNAIEINLSLKNGSIIKQQ